MKYTFAPAVDGGDYPEVERSFPDREAAIAHGADVLRLVTQPIKPNEASVVVWYGDALEGEPLGEWIWSRAEPTAVWAADS